LIPSLKLRKRRRIEKGVRVDPFIKVKKTKKNWKGRRI